MYRVIGVRNGVYSLRTTKVEGNDIKNSKNLKIWSEKISKFQNSKKMYIVYIWRKKLLSKKYPIVLLL